MSKDELRDEFEKLLRAAYVSGEEAGKKALQAEIDAGVLELVGSHGTGWPVGTLVETGQLYRAERDEARAKVAWLTDNRTALEKANGELFAEREALKAKLAEAESKPPKRHDLDTQLALVLCRWRGVQINLASTRCLEDDLPAVGAWFDHATGEVAREFSEWLLSVGSKDHGEKR